MFGLDRARLQTRLWLLFAGASAASVAVYFALPAVLAAAGAPVDSAIPQAVLYDMFGAASAAAVLAGVALYRPSLRLPWLLIAGGQLAFVAGDVVWDVLSLGLGQEPFPSVADAAYLSAYPLLVAAMGVFVARRVPRPRGRWLIELGIVAGALGLVLWVVMVEPLLAEAETPPFELAVSLAYPIGDIALLAVLVSASLSPRVSTVPDVLFAMGLTALLAADVAFATMTELQVAGSPIDALYLAHYALFACAALHPTMRSAGDAVATDRPLTSRRLAILAAAALLPPALLAVEAVFGLGPHLAPISVAWVGLTMLVLLDALALIRDQQAALERRRALEAELFESRKLESVGRLAGGVAHDFNNILTSIIGFADLAIGEAPKADVESLRHIRDSAQRAAALVQKLLAFGRRQVLQERAMDLAAAARSSEPVVRQLLGERVQVGLFVPETPVAVVADPAQLDQVLLNLALNARDAMPDGGRFRLALRTRGLLAGSLPRSEMRPGRYAVLSVGDTGVGMDEGTMAHIFEPFFTTKEAGRGYGLGLATTYGIVRQSGGFIDVRSEPGVGTIFDVYLPLASAAEAAQLPEAVAPPESQPAPAPREVHVLIVEDEGVVRDLAARILRDAGYRVSTAPGPVGAVESVCAGTRVDVLLSDIVMPAMSGFELARQVRTLLRADLPVVLMSGYAEAMTRTSDEERTRFLPKPFSSSELLTAVAESLP